MKRSIASAFSPKKKGRESRDQSSVSVLTGIEESDASAKQANFMPFGGIASASTSSANVSRNSSEYERKTVMASPYKNSPTRLLLGNRGETTKADLTTQKIINDPIHTSIKLDRLCCKIIDTPQYQRLRNLKQLGTCVYVFPSATHTRFEHSLGVAHLSHRLCTALDFHQKELNITTEDILCVKVAGLCHDLGHGPFSHVFDGVFIKMMFPDGLKNNDGSKWRHEDGSVQMFRYILSSNSIKLSDFGLSARDQLFIEEIIQGTPEAERKGRGAEKFFLYDIVNNTRSGLDVDKLDYFQRDMRYANVTLAANFERFIELGRVVRATPIANVHSCRFDKTEIGGWVPSQDQYGDHSNDNDGNDSEYSDKHQLMVCYPQKLVYEAIDIFSIRFRMHKQVYTHKAVKQVEFMITDALIAADPYLKISGSKSKNHPDGKYRMSECIFDMEAMSNLNDSVIEMIKYDSNPGLQRAKDIVRRMEKRQLYTCLGKSPFTREEASKGLVKSEKAIGAEIRAISSALAADPNMTGTRYNYTHNEMIEQFGENNGGGGGGGEPSPLAVLNEGTCNSQDSFYSIGMTANTASGSQQSAVQYVALDEEDIIVEKMHIHYGLKEKNPVGRMRFFPKKATTDVIGEEVKDKVYLTSMPNRFEEFAVRVFCRHVDKEATARKAFQLWCKEKLAATPFQLNAEDDDEEDPDAVYISGTQ